MASKVGAKGYEDDEGASKAECGHPCLLYTSIQNMIHLLVALAHRQSAHCIAVQVHFPYSPCMFYTYLIHHAALVDAEQQLLTVHRCLLYTSWFHPALQYGLIGFLLGGKDLGTA